MESLDQSLEFLEWPTKAVNAVRALLGDLNVPLPAWVAQALGFLVLLVLVYYLLRIAFKDREKPGLARVAAGVAGLSAGIAALAIVIAWVDEMVVPPSQQLVGTVAGAPLESVQIDLLDYRGQPLGARVGKDLASALFAINYVPEFADPPSAVFLKAPGCE